MRYLLPLTILAIGCSGQNTPEPAEMNTPNDPAERVTTYRGMCDASAAVMIDRVTFMAADDEKNVLAVYRTDRPGLPVQTVPWDEHLGIEPGDEHPEVDIEGVARLGDRIYWIGSHGRNKSGKWRPNRHRLFAMTLTKTPDGIVARPYGTAYRKLAQQMAADPRLRELGLAEAIDIGDEKDKDLAPKEAGLNIEGLSAMADGRSLLIALRNPRPDGMALLVPLHNPDDVVSRGAVARLGRPIQWRLTGASGNSSDGLGIRAIEYSSHHRAYLIVAGSHTAGGPFAMYRWTGREDQPPELLVEPTRRLSQIENFSPEAIMVMPEDGTVRLLSDDGALKVEVASESECEPGTFESGRCDAKSLNDRTRKTFKSMAMEIE